jgi:hypothetical protein
MLELDHWISMTFGDFPEADWFNLLFEGLSILAGCGDWNNLALGNESLENGANPLPLHECTVDAENDMPIHGKKVPQTINLNSGVPSDIEAFRKME